MLDSLAVRFAQLLQYNCRSRSGQSCTGLLEIAQQQRRLAPRLSPWRRTQHKSATLRIRYLDFEQRVERFDRGPWQSLSRVSQSFPCRNCKWDPGVLDYDLLRADKPTPYHIHWSQLRGVAHKGGKHIQFLLHPITSTYLAPGTCSCAQPTR